jgi:hypothetical protein
MDGYNEVEEELKGAKQMAAVQLPLLHQDQTNLIGYLCLDSESTAPQPRSWPPLQIPSGELPARHLPSPLRAM